MNGLIVRPATEVPRESWNDFVLASDEAWMQHLHQFGTAMEKWPNFVNRSFAIVAAEAPDTLLAVGTCLVNADNWVSCTNPAWRPGLDPESIQSIRNVARREWISRAQDGNCGAIYAYMPVMTPALRGSGSPAVSPLSDLQMESIQTQSYVIDLRPGIDAIWKGLASHCRTHIRKAEKEGVVIREASGPDDLATYYRMHCETYGRSGLAPHPEAYFQRIWEDFIPAGFARVFFAERDGKVIAADNETTFKRAMGGWTAAGMIEGSKIGANNLLHWHAIRWAVENGYDWYDSGEGFPDATSGKNKGLTDFKKSFGGAVYPYFKGQIVFSKTRAVGDMDAVGLTAAGADLATSITRRLVRKARKFFGWI